MSKSKPEERILRLLKNMELKIVQLSDSNGLKNQVQQLIFDKNDYEIKIQQLESEMNEILSRNEKLEKGSLAIKELEGALSQASDEIVNLNNSISEFKGVNQGVENKLRNWINEKRQQ